MTVYTHVHGHAHTHEVRGKPYDCMVPALFKCASSEVCKISCWPNKAKTSLYAQT